MILLSFILLTQCAPPPTPTSGGGAGGVETPTKFSKRGTRQDLSFYRWVAGKEGADFFCGGEGCSFYMKNKLKS